MIRFFLRHPTSANLMMAVFMILGIMALPGLRRETFVDFLPKRVSVTVAYPGATADEVDESVIQLVEDAISSVRYVREVRSESRDGLGIVTAEMEPDWDSSIFLNDIKTEVEAVDDLPEDAEKPVVRLLGQTKPVVSLAVTGPMEPSVLRAYGREIRDEIRALPGVSQAQLSGFSDRQYQVMVSLPLLRQHGLTVGDVARAVGSQNIDLPVGSLESSARKISLRVAERRRSKEALESMVISEGLDGGRILLGDVAEVLDDFEVEEEKILFDGQRAAFIVVSKTDTEDSLRVLEEIKVYLKGKMPQLSPGVSINLTDDYTTIVRDRLDMLIKNGFQGFLLVFITLFMFFDGRFSLWVAMGLPVSFLGAMFLFPILGQTLNMVSMVALLMGLGLVMDDAIVISENIASHLAMGKGHLEAATDGVKEVWPGVLSSFLTTAAVFVPLLTVQGQMGRVFQPIPVVLLSVLAVSLVEAFFILPHHLAHSRGGLGFTDKYRKKVNLGMAYVRDRWVMKAVDWAVDNRYWTLGLTVFLFLGSLALVVGGVVKIQAFPDMDGDVLEARILMPQGISLSQTEMAVGFVVQASNSMSLSDMVTHRAVEYGIHRGLDERGAHVATVKVNLIPAEKRNFTVDQMVDSWSYAVGRIPGVLSLTFAEPTLGPQGRAIEICLQGTDLGRLKEASIDLRRWLEGIRGVRDLDDDMKPGRLEIVLKPLPGVLAMGLSSGEIARQVRRAFYGEVVDSFHVGAERFEVNVKLSDKDMEDVRSLMDLPVALPGGADAPLGSLVSLEFKRPWSRMHRLGGVKTVTVVGDVNTSLGNTADILAYMRQAYLPEFERKYPDLSMTLDGEAGEMGETQASMKRALLLGVLGIFVLLCFQFRSYIEPLVVLLAIPFAFIGVICGSVIMDIPLSMPGIMGFVSLAGVVVNNSILLVEFIRMGMEEGLSVVQAAKGASGDRFRAIFLTTMTTVAGMVPLMFERDLQAQVLIPLAVSVVFGLIGSTLLVLVVLPSLYAIMEDRGWIRPLGE